MEKPISDAADNIPGYYCLRAAPDANSRFV